MKQPFDLKLEPEKAVFFAEMTTALETWMLEKYPTLDTDLDTKLKQINSLQIALNISFENHRKMVLKDKQSLRDHIINEINEFLKKEYPDMNREFQRDFVAFKKTVATHAKNAEETKKQLKEIINSNELYKDVYLLRDQFCEFKQVMDSFKDKMKKVFSI